LNIFDLTIEDMIDYMKRLGEPSFRASQLYKWLYSGVESFSCMTDLSKSLREQVDKDFYIYIPKIEKKLVSKIDGTVKYLFAMHDNTLIESVVMRYQYGVTICVSSQAGCRMGCAFCASTLNGLERNLTAGEIMGQIIKAQIDIGERISNVVMMGSGEPLDNFDNTIKFLKNAVSPNGMKIGARHITVSTCGILDKIDKLSECNMQVNLSVSLHAPSDELRKTIMPIAKTVKIDELVNKCRDFFNKTGRRVTFEYALIGGVNDSTSYAIELAKLLSGAEDFHVNLIPINEVSERNFQKGSKERIGKFMSILQKNNVNVTLRREMGADINAACGQLRNSERENIVERSNL